MRLYNNRHFMASLSSTTKLPAPKKVRTKRKPPHSIPLNDEEDSRLMQLMARYQEAVVAHNKRREEHNTANVTPCDIMRTGMIELEKLTPEELRVAVLNAKQAR
jgi:hypothetical protein